MTLTTTVVLLSSVVFASNEEAPRIAQTEEAYGVMVHRYQDTPTLQPFQQRLSDLEQVTQQIYQSLEAVQGQSMNALLQDVAAVPLAVAPARSGVPVRQASSILSEFRPTFVEAVPLPSMQEAEIDTLRNHYRNQVDRIQNQIVERARKVVGLDDQARTLATEMCLILPFLHRADEEWTEADTESLPSWAREAESLGILESFALRSRRPYTAYQLAALQEQPAPAQDQPVPPFMDYLAAAANQVAERGEYHAALHCLRTAIGIADDRRDAERSSTLRFQLAALFSETGHPAMAADELKLLAAGDAPGDAVGRAAMLRMKYLYEAERFDQIIAESPGYQADEACRPYLPQILYITWVTHRRNNEPDQANQIEERFIEKYPQHPLGADMHFAAAMTALASSDYDEAMRKLEIIEYRYPESRLLDRVKQLRERLEQVADDKDQ